MSIDEEKLYRYLQKCELQYRAKHTQDAASLEWLAPHCESVQQIAEFLRSIGFRIRNIVDEEPWPGEKHQWVETTSGVIVYVGCDGLFGKASDKMK